MRGKGDVEDTLGCCSGACGGECASTCAHFVLVTCAAATASKKCTATTRHVRLRSQGTFSYQSLSGDWAIAQWVREHGAVVTRFDIMDDFKAFFADSANAGRVYKPKPGAKLVELHAVIIIG